MEISIDPGSSLPIYAQLMDRVKHMIATGALKPGDQLPTVRQLGVNLRVNPNTIARVYTELSREGIISSQQGRGTYIAQKPEAAALSRLRGERLQSLVGRMALEAMSLGYQPAEIKATLDAELARIRANPD